MPLQVFLQVSLAKSQSKIEIAKQTLLQALLHLLHWILAPDTMQVMPQLLSSLGIDDEHDSSLDWATLAIYSCAASCDSSDAYTEEYVWVQV